MENCSAAGAAKKQHSPIFLGNASYKDDLFPEGLSHFAFRRLSEKQNKENNSAILASLRED